MSFDNLFLQLGMNPNPTKSELRKALDSVQGHFKNGEMLKTFADSLVDNDFVTIFPYAGRNTVVFSAMKRCLPRALTNEKHPLLEKVHIISAKEFKEIFELTYTREGRVTGLWFEEARKDDATGYNLWALGKEVGKKELDEVNTKTSGRYQVFHFDHSRFVIYDEDYSQARFGAIRKHDIHTGFDIHYVLDTEITAYEKGTVVAIENFTGPSADSPWWNDTKAVLIESEIGVLCYGEIEPCVNVGDVVEKGQVVGKVVSVLKKYKGRPMSMLHLELYRHGTRKTCWWKLGEPQPEELLNIEEYLGIK